jgi:hypothetical protein
MKSLSDYSTFHWQLTCILLPLVEHRTTGIMSSDFKSKQKGKKQISQLHGGGGCNCIKKVSKESTLLDKELLLTDAIYGKKVPEEMQGYLFHYRVTAYFTETKTFCEMYMTHMIFKDGNVWKHQDGNHVLVTTCNQLS